LATAFTTARKRSRNKKQKTKPTYWWILLLPLFFLVPFYYGQVYSKILSAYYRLSGPASSPEYPHYDSFNIRIPRGYQVHGIDVSRYQGRIDWDRVSRMKDSDVKVHFSFIKATEGVLWADPTFQRNWQESANAGIIRGAYHYFNPYKSGYWQARFFLQTVNFGSGDILPIVDIEERGNQTRQKFQENLSLFLNEIEKKLGVKPIIYTGYKFYEDYLSGDFNSYPLWVAHYNRPKLKAFSGDVNWSFWQHSDKGRVDGIRHKVDMNVFNGSLKDLEQLRIRN
jgi:lysozyme